ncbi:helix-turn-helix transcriptional regulator [Oscillospiraceae bacterium 50-58]
MGAPEFVQNVKMYCKLRGVKPTIAMRESGVGTSFINNIEKGSAPSVFKVQQLAAYLNVTTSELLGETGPSLQYDGYIIPSEPGATDLIVKFKQLTPEGQKEVLAYVEFKKTQESKKP